MATMANGAVTFNNVTDEQLGKALEFKAKHEALNFNPAILQQTQGQRGVYNNMVISWNGNESYLVAHELITLMIEMSKTA